jgi:hypothetical protein
MEKFLRKIDFKLLKKQKQTLLKVIFRLNKEGKQKEEDGLTGILTLIDNLQDEAVDKYGYKERTVFKLKKQ